jgi:hypothetical protein
VQLKINHQLGSDSCVYSWYTGLHGSEQYMYVQYISVYNCLYILYIYTSVWLCLAICLANCYKKTQFLFLLLLYYNVQDNILN